jgi:hypothetical protein
MPFPIIDLNAPTDLAFRWGWLLATVANAIVFLLVVGVFVLGMFVRLPRARRDIEAVERARDTAESVPGEGSR